MQRACQSFDRLAPIAAVVVAMVATATPAHAEDRLNLPEITIMGSPPLPEPSQKPCTDPTDHSMGCLNQQMKRQVDQVNPSLTVAPIDAKSPDLKVGVVNIPGVQQQYGQNFGKSAVPFRPPPPIYNSIGRH